MKLTDYLNVKEAAEQFGVTPTTIRSWVRDNKIKHYRHPINKFILFKKSDIEEFLNSIAGLLYER